MTALNVFRMPDRAVILTDGAGYDDEGRLIARVNKTVAIPHLRAAVAARGASVIPALVAAELGTFETFDAMLEGAIEHLKARWQVIAGGLAEIQIAGWSESEDCAKSIAFTTGETVQVPAFEPLELEDISTSPQPSPVHLFMFCRPDLDGDNFDPETDGLDLIESQRFIPLPPSPSAKPGCIVGAFAMMTTIDRDGVSQKIVKRWPDVVGEQMRPERAYD